MTTYVEREPRKPDRVYAARFLAGLPLDDLEEVARRDNYSFASVDLAPIPAWNALAVRHQVIPDDGPAWMDYDVLNDGDWLVFGTLGVLYVMTDEWFNKEFKEEEAQ